MSSDEVASRLSSKLLQGWCMLDKSCDLCNTPIMMDKEKKEFCCGCQIFTNLPKSKESQDNLRKPSSKEEAKDAQPQVAEFNYQHVISDRLRINFEETCGSLLDRIVKSDDLDECGKISELVMNLSLAYKQFNLK